MKINGLTEWKCQSCKSTFHTIEGVVPENKCPDCYKPGTLVAGEEDGRQPSVAQTTPDDEAKPQARSAFVGEHAPVTDGAVELKRVVVRMIREARLAQRVAKKKADLLKFSYCHGGEAALVELYKVVFRKAEIAPAVSSKINEPGSSNR